MVAELPSSLQMKQSQRRKTLNRPVRGPFGSKLSVVADMPAKRPRCPMPGCRGFMHARLWDRWFHGKAGVVSRCDRCGTAIRQTVSSL